MPRRSGLVILMLALAAPLNGCVLPPVVTIASYSADIVSYEATGKTVTDHVWSKLARSDCSFVRILKDKPICVDPPAASASTVAAVPPEDGAPREAAAFAALPTPLSAPATARDRYVRIGSFAERANAERAVARYADYHAAIVPVVAHGRAFARVVAGPMTGAEAAALQAQLAAVQMAARAGPRAKPHA